MEIKYSLVQIGRNVENGRYCGQIQLGDGFLKQVSEMSSSISWLGFQNEKTAYKIDLLNYKINRILANKIEFECKGIDFSKSTDFSDLEIVVIRNLASTISQNLCAFIDDFEKWLYKDFKKVGKEGKHVRAQRHNKRLSCRRRDCQRP